VTTIINKFFNIMVVNLNVINGAILVSLTKKYFVFLIDFFLQIMVFKFFFLLIETFSHFDKASRGLVVVLDIPE
jgi:hypothetical protein